MSKGKILFQLSGSIACYKSCTLISRLTQEGYDVEIVASKSALNFVGTATLEGLTGRPVHIETFAEGGCMNHIHLQRWCDLAILCPATANMLNKLASGIGDDLISTLFLSHDFKKPYLVAPAMNTMMYRHPATQASIERLQNWGVRVLETASGVLACGEQGEGRLMEPDLVYAEIMEALQTVSRPQIRPTSGDGFKVLVTAGGTRESIDGVRSISNTSTGQTGAAIADFLALRGHDVTYVHADNAVMPHTPVEAYAFSDFHSLDQMLRNLLHRNRFDAVIHLAAVSDYSVDRIEVDGRMLAPASDTKMETQDSLRLHLRKNHKIVDHLKSYALYPGFTLIAFKLTSTGSDEERRRAIEGLSTRSGVDYVVHNDLSEITAADHRATLFKGPEAIARIRSKNELAQTLEKLITENGRNKSSLSAPGFPRRNEDNRL